VVITLWSTDVSLVSVGNRVFERSEWGRSPCCFVRLTPLHGVAERPCWVGSVPGTVPLLSSTWPSGSVGLAAVGGLEVEPAGCSGCPLLGLTLLHQEGGPSAPSAGGGLLDRPASRAGVGW
jgi:hypothetical protein